MVYSRIIYGIVIYGACRSSLLKKIQVLQNKLLKVLFKMPFRTDTTKMHLDLDILKVHDIYRYQIQKFVYESLNESCIVQFHKYYRYNNAIHDQNTRQQNELYKPRIKTNYGKSSLRYYGVVLWNRVDIKIRRSTTLDSFKGALRQTIIDSYRNPNN